MSSTHPRTGVLALQGAFGLHRAVLTRLGEPSTEVRTIEDLLAVDRLIIPGGESSVMAKLADESGMMPVLRGRIEAGMPVLGTCAGAIMLAAEIVDGRVGQPSIGVLDITVRRNAFGRQAESFTTNLAMIDDADPAAEAHDFEAVFIRAPGIERTGSAVATMASYDGQPVMVLQENVIATTFHPELSGDDTVHRLFLNL